MWKNLELLTVLLAVLRPSLALQQKDAGNSGSSSKYAPYACFTGECAAAAAASKGTRDTSAFETCLKACEYWGSCNLGAALAWGCTMACCNNTACTVAS
jgi:hypothetical protein